MLTGDPAAELVPLREVVTGRPSVDMARFARRDSPGHFRGIFSFLDADGRNCGAVSCTIDGKEVRTDYVPKVATDICGLAKGRDGRIYGSTIISMNVSASLHHRHSTNHHQSITQDHHRSTTTPPSQHQPS